MSAQQLITEHIDLWTSTIKAKKTQGRGSNKKRELYGIKKLRELILELAVRGKLVPQDPSDEPASVLLERIAAEKSQLVKDKKIKKQKPLSDITEEGKPFEPPEGWDFCHLRDIMNVLNGRAYKKHEMLETGVPLLRVGNLFTSKEWYYSDIDLEPEKYIDNGDLIYAWSASFGPFIWDGGKVIYHYHIWKLDQYHEPSISKFYLLNYLQAITASIKASGNGIAMIHMTKERMEKLVLPIAPLSEQHRIVAKVDELMALCDQLEQQTESSLDAHNLLVDTLLSTLTDARDAKELSDNWARLADHFDTLITTDYAVEQLKQTILQLAVMGKLVPQDPNDEPASELLKRIAAEKEQLVKDKKIKKQKLLPEIIKEEKPFELPAEWTWSRIGDVISLKNGYAFRSKYFIHDSTPFVLTTPGNFYETGGFKDRGNKTRFYDSDVQPEFILNSGDLMIPMTEQAPGLLGSSAFIPDDDKKYLHNQRLGKLIPYCDRSTTLEFIALFFNAPYLRGALAESCSGTTVRHTSPDKIYNVLFPVFSVPEQQRIVAKVNKLMALCDQLKIQLNNAQTTQLHLSDAIVEKALTA